jgi:hypothetical protein
MQPNRPQIDEAVRRQLLDNYLKNQQMQASHSPQLTSPSFHPSMFQSPFMENQSDTMSETSSRRVLHNSIVQVNAPSISSQPMANIVTELPENISIEDFSTLVKKWIEIDNWLKKSQEIMKEKRKQKDKLKEVITHYMTKYNIEDLNTSEGKIRCKVQYVKSGVNQKVVKEKIVDLLKDDETTRDTLLQKIFEERQKVEKMSLRRIKIT